MSDGDYAEMIEIPVSSCEMVVLPKKRKKKNLRKRVIDKVNRSLEVDSKPEATTTEDVATDKKEVPQKTERKFKFDIVSAQVLAIFVLITAILITNIFWEDSGINTLLRSVFKTEAKATVDERDYKSFTVFAPTNQELKLNDGVMTLSSESAVYAPCQGEVTDIRELDGKYTVTVKHSDVFKTVIRNADYAYFEVGDVVYHSVPVCYTSGGAEVLLYSGDSLLTNYTISDGSIVWQS